MSVDELIRRAFEKAIVTGRKEFEMNPLRHFSEKDIHWFISWKIEQELVSCGVQDYPDQVWPTAIKGFSTSLVHQEYGVVGHTNEKYDVCVLHPNEVSKINGYDLTVDGDYVCPLAIAEYTTERFGGRFSKKSARIVDGDLVDKFEEDIRKLERSDARDKYAEMYYRVTSSSEGRARRNVERYKQRLSMILDRASSEYPSVQAKVIIYYLFDERVESLPG